MRETEETHWYSCCACVCARSASGSPRNASAVAASAAAAAPATSAPAHTAGTVPVARVQCHPEAAWACHQPAMAESGHTQLSVCVQLRTSSQNSQSRRLQLQCLQQAAHLADQHLQCRSAETPWPAPAVSTSALRNDTQLAIRRATVLRQCIWKIRGTPHVADAPSEDWGDAPSMTLLPTCATKASVLMCALIR